MLANQQIRSEFEKKFKCIQSDCDGRGCIPNQVAEDEWEAQQCQFHAEYLFPIADFFLTLRSQELAELREKVEGIDMPSIHSGVCKDKMTKEHMDGFACGWNEHFRLVSSFKANVLALLPQPELEQ